ncbi:DeoR/GlpR family DNA-binding transcription regulator [Streptomyces sp. NPDC059917]|uniref:DeoR/GlpR family DNA-binding transcription regulator n=1 Tax=Streptomyces sp. NPDC059917 TaxID=3347002 RepID=UPI003659600E
MAPTAAPAEDAPGGPVGADLAPDRCEVREARRRLIREGVLAQGFVRSADLAAEHDVSLMTVHRDLDHLQAQGWLRKVRGGATSESSPRFHGSVADRSQAMASTKRRLARAAAQLLTPGQTVMLDDSTTCARITRYLVESAPLTVITNSLPAMTRLARQPGVQLISLGGTYFPAYEAHMGPHTADSVREYSAGIVFMSATAITKGRLYNTSPETVHVKRAMLAAAKCRVLVADHTKFHQEGLYALAPLTDFDFLVVDDGLGAKEIRAIRERGTQVVVVARP